MNIFTVRFIKKMFYFNLDFKIFVPNHLQQLFLKIRSDKRRHAVYKDLSSKSCDEQVLLNV